MSTAAGPPADPSPAEAARVLRELDAIGVRSRRAAYATLTRTPLALWGVAWLTGYALLDLTPWALAVPVGLAVSAAAVAGTWRSGAQDVLNGWEQRVRLSWLVLMASSPPLLMTVSPLPMHAVLIFLGALWGVALLLYAVAVGDIPLGAVGTVVLVTAAAVRVLGLDHDLLTFGVFAGGAMTALGAYRMSRPA